MNVLVGAGFSLLTGIAHPAEIFRAARIVDGER